ncbi:hypothetical protein TWF481_006702 [Arthrobotrys musiformis]|uniref:Uncharacterized protein n=1 Tax=Arthrobotrys musiformis TaxID=47236 RepID=A0AAV9WBB8_9PEZI
MSTDPSSQSVTIFSTESGSDESEEISVLVEHAQKIFTAASKTTTPKQFVTNIKCNIFFKTSWDLTLIAAPTCLELLGACNVVASTKWARVTELTPPKNGFTYLKGYKYLGASLVEITNRGRIAFKSGHDNMGAIKLESNDMKETVKTLWKLMYEPNVEIELVKVQLETLLDTAERCKKAAETMEADFNSWLNYVMELHEACQEADGSNEAKFRTYASEEAANKALKKAAEKQRDAAKATRDRFEKQLDRQFNQYMDLLDKFPDSSTFLKQQLAMTAMDTVSQVIQIGATSVAARNNPLSALALSGRRSGKKRGSEDDDSGDEDLDLIPEIPYSDRENKILNDPALSQCKGIESSMVSLKEILTGSKQDGVDWERVLRGGIGGKEDETPAGPDGDGGDGDGGDGEGDGEEGGAKPPRSDKEKEGKDDTSKKPEGTSGKKPTEGSGKKPTKKNDTIKIQSKDKDGSKDEPDAGEEEEKDANLKVIQILLKAAKEGLTESKDSKTRAGKVLVKALSNSLTVIDEVFKEGRKGLGSKEWKKPGKNSDIVKGWVKAVSDDLKSVRKLSASSSSRPGFSPGNPPVIFQDRAAKAKVKAKTDINRATLEAAQAQTEISQKGLIATQDIYKKSVDDVVELEGKLGKIEAEMAKLTEKKLTLEVVRDVIRNCIAYLIQLKDKITQLAKFFTTVASIVRSAVNTAVIPYEKHMQIAFRSKVNGKIISQTLLELIHQYTLVIAANFSLFADISDMYLQIDKDYITKGLNLVDKLQGGKDDSQISEKKTQLSIYTKEAKAGIRNIVKKKAEDILAGVADQIKDIEKVLLLPLPPLSETTKAAIKDGVDSMQKEVQEEEIPIQKGSLVYLTLEKEERTRDAETLSRGYRDEDIDF